MQHWVVLESKDENTRYGSHKRTKSKYQVRTPTLVGEMATQRLCRTWYLTWAEEEQQGKTSNEYRVTSILALHTGPPLGMEMA